MWLQLPLYPVSCPNTAVSLSLCLSLSLSLPLTHTHICTHTHTHTPFFPSSCLCSPEIILSLSQLGDLLQIDVLVRQIFPSHRLSQSPRCSVVMRHFTLCFEIKALKQLQNEGKKIWLERVVCQCCALMNRRDFHDQKWNDRNDAANPRDTQTLTLIRVDLPNQQIW